SSSSSSSPALRAVAGWVAGTMAGLSRGIWGQSVLPDIWTVTLLSLMICLTLLSKWRLQPERRRYLWMTLFGYGLSIANSQLLWMMAPCLPIFVASVDRRLARDLSLLGGLTALVACAGFQWLWPDHWSSSVTYIRAVQGTAVWACLFGGCLCYSQRDLFSTWRASLIGIAAVTTGLLLCFLPALFAMANPPINWAYPRTTSGFFHLLTRGQFERLQP